MKLTPMSRLTCSNSAHACMIKMLARSVENAWKHYHVISYRFDLKPDGMHRFTFELFGIDESRDGYPQPVYDMVSGYVGSIGQVCITEINGAHLFGNDIIEVIP